MESRKVYDNRELSWLKFNTRVLEEAQDAAVPLFERLFFVSIYASNLDEFFMIRVGSLFDQTLLNQEQRENKTNMTAAEQLQAIYARVAELAPRRDAAYAAIMESLSAAGAQHVPMDTLSGEEITFLEAYFDAEILPLISPQIIDKHHPFPFLRNKEIYIGVWLELKAKSPRLGLIPASGVFERLVRLPGEGPRFVLVEELILAFAHKVFESYTVLHRCVFRITRNADINVEEALYDHDVDFRDVMAELLKKRRKLSPVRLEVNAGCGQALALAIAEKLELSPQQIFAQSSPLDFGFLSALERGLEGRSELFFQPLSPQPSHAVTEEPMMHQLQRGDILLSYPYQSIRPFIRLLEEAAADPAVVSVKITLYRVARESQVIDALIRAAERGKEVLAVVELRARFDEENNIGWSKRLEEAGCTVLYGLDDMKVHSKLLLITRKAGAHIEYFTQIGTGNYNEKTARLYTDLSLMTANREIGADASLVFNSLSIGRTLDDSRHLLVAPLCLKSRVIEHIDNEIARAKLGEEAYIGLKLNSLTDRGIIEKLLEASRAGVRVELLIRGICCLIAGVPGLSDNITVTSIVGRFLEHSRIYCFGMGERRSVYISSADFMTRNTERRVEVAAPVYDRDLRDHLMTMFALQLRDNVKARRQLPDGTYVKSQRVPSERPLDTQMFFYEEAYRQAERLALAHGSKPVEKQSLFRRLLGRILPKRGV